MTNTLFTFLIYYKHISPLQPVENISTYIHVSNKRETSFISAEKIRKIWSMIEHS